MMCRPCRHGGLWTRMGDDAGAPVLPVNGNAYRLNAFNSHAACQYPKTCTCQHVCQSMIQKRADG